MQWRALVMLLVGIATIYLVSLVSNPPLPRPMHIFASYPDPSATSRSESSELILTVAGNNLVQTTFWYEIPSPNRIKHGIGPIKTGVAGKIEQKQIALDSIHSNSTDGTWTIAFEHYVQGPISKISRAPPPSSKKRRQERRHFGAMYHILNDEDIQHIVRIYYQSTPHAPFLFKDVVLPGSTWIDAFTLEQDHILYSRDPDQYKFRIAELPSDLLRSPHSMIQLENTMPGDPIKKGHQPRSAQKHKSILAKMHSPNPDTFRVLSFDVYKTPSIFHINVALTDGNLASNNVEWKVRDRGTFTPSVYSADNVQYMTFADGAHFRHDRVEKSMPKAVFARTEDAKTIVVAYIQNGFLTFDYTDRVDILQHDRDERKHLYKENGEFLPEYYFWFEEDLMALDETDIVGMEINERGNLLAMWTQINALYVFMRGEKRDTNPHNRVSPLTWELAMVETRLSSSPISAVTFWNTTVDDNTEQRNYMAVSLKNQETHVYWLDQLEEPKHPDIWHFVTSRWDMLLAMSLLLSMFVFSELHRPS